MSSLQSRITTGPLARVKTSGDIRELPPDTDIVFVEALNDELAMTLTTLRSVRALVQDGNSTITDIGVSPLASLVDLEWLDLEWSTQLTDCALEALTQLPELRYLDSSFCSGLTNGGIQALKAARPEVEIDL